MLSTIVYLDNNASTPADPAVIEAMAEQLTGGYGNPSGEHAWGRAAAEAMTLARRRIAELADVPSSCLYFTSGATESNNTVFAQLPTVPCGRRRILLSPVEHKSVLEPAYALTAQGYGVETLPMIDGKVDVGGARRLFDDEVAFVSVMLANNETGHVQPVAELADAAHEVGALVHCDATQAFGKIPVSLTGLGVDLASFSGHKMHGPMGVGALFVRRGLPVIPLLRGGGHQKGARAGTENIPGIVGFGVAAERARVSLHADTLRVRQLTQLLASLLQSAVPTTQVLSAAEGLPNTLLVRLPGLEAEQVLAHAPLVAASTGSACATLSPEPSHVLLALWGDETLARECLRLSLSRFTAEEEIRAAADHLIAAAMTVRHLRAAA